MSDFRIDNHGSILVLHALTPAAQEWASEHLAGDEVQHWGQHGTVVEPRYIEPIIDGIEGDGLEVQR